MKKTCVLFLTHFFDPFIKDAFDRLITQSPENYDVFLALNVGHGAIAPAECREYESRLFISNIHDLLDLEYPEKCRPEGWTGNGWTINPGNVDTVPLAFWRRFQQYDYIWGVEYDVHFEGKWSTLFSHFERSESDVLGTGIHRITARSFEIPNPPLIAPDGTRLATDGILQGFFPIFRLSKRALKAFDEAYQRGWGGHYEKSWPTIAAFQGLKIEDIGGNGSFVAPENVNRFYFNTPDRWSLAPGTCVFRPAIQKVLRRRNTLWHPVKPKGAPTWSPLLTASGLRQVRELVKSYYLRTIVWGWFLLFWRSDIVVVGDGGTRGEDSKYHDNDRARADR